MGERHLARVRARRVSTMLQGATRNLLPYATARQNIGFARLGTDPPSGGRRWTTATCSAGSGSRSRPTRSSSTMSGGQRQRLALACAVATGPSCCSPTSPPANSATRTATTCSS